VSTIGGGEQQATEENKVLEALSQLHGDLRDLISLIEKNNEDSLRPRRVYLWVIVIVAIMQGSYWLIPVLESRLMMFMP
jgi:hypothetical protein